MLILHAFLALAAGFLTMALLIGIATVLLKKFVPEWVGTPGEPRTGYVFVNFGYSFTAAMAGGYITAWIGHSNPLVYTVFLALIVLLMAALSALQTRGQQPIWYQLALLALTPAGVTLGGLIRLRIEGLL